MDEEEKTPANQCGPAAPGPVSPRERLAEAYDACAGGLFRYALMITADRCAAEDAVQQTFTKLAAGGRDLSEIASRNGYLRSAVRNECYRILSRRRKAAADPISVEILEAANEEDVDREQQQAVQRALGALPPEQRETVHMKIYEQKTFDRIAAELGISINTAASRYRYAIDKLRRLLGPHSLEGRHDD